MPSSLSHSTSLIDRDNDLTHVVIGSWDAPLRLPVSPTDRFVRLPPRGSDQLLSPPPPPPNSLPKAKALVLCPCCLRGYLGSTSPACPPQFVRGWNGAGKTVKAAAKESGRGYDEVATSDDAAHVVD